MKKIGFFALILLMGMSACEYEIIEPIVVGPSDTAISFSDQIAPIFVDLGCVACHPGMSSKDFTPEKSYETLISNNLVNIEDPASSVLVVTINAGHNTAINATAQQKADILQWITEGAKDN